MSRSDDKLRSRSNLVHNFTHEMQIKEWFCCTPDGMMVPFSHWKKPMVPDGLNLLGRSESICTHEKASTQSKTVAKLLTIVCINLTLWYLTFHNAISYTRTFRRNAGILQIASVRLSVRPSVRHSVHVRDTLWGHLHVYLYIVGFFCTVGLSFCIVGLTDQLIPSLWGSLWGNRKYRPIQLTWRTSQCTSRKNVRLSVCHVF